MTSVGERNQAKLAAMARQRGVATDLLTIRFVMERFLARLAISAHGDRFALKGALLLTVWHGDLLRATTDVDLHGLHEDDCGRMLGIVLDVCATIAEADDGILFDGARAVWTRLAGGRIGGDRVTVPLQIGRAEARLKVDVGFGHPVTPGYERRWYPSLLPGFRPSSLVCYPRETAIAEKLATAVEFGGDNTRLRDYWDLHALSRHHSYAGHLLVEAVRATFASREAGEFVARDDDYWTGSLRPEFGTAARCKLWRSWIRSHAPSSDLEFPEALSSVIEFSMPLLHAVRNGGRLPGYWNPTTGWSRRSRTSDLRSGPGAPGPADPGGDPDGRVRPSR